MPHARFTRRDRSLIRALAHRRAPCLLCRAPGTVAVLFLPRNPEVWGGVQGKIRLIGYSLCAGCKAHPDAALRAEATIMADLVARRN